MTCSSILARIRSTLIDIFLTELTTEPIHTETLEVPDPIEACSAIVTGRGCTVVSVYEAVASFVTFSAATFITAMRVYTCGTVPARIVLALIDVIVAIATGKTEWAGAEVVPVVGSRGTRCAVGTFAWLAWVHFSFTSFTGVGRFADALEFVNKVYAGAAILAGSQHAVVDVQFTVLAGEAFGALAEVGVEMCAALSAVLARIGFAKV